MSARLRIKQLNKVYNLVMENTEELKKEITSLKIRIQRLEEMLSSFPDPKEYLQDREGLGDPLFEKAVEIVKEYNEVSASLFQRRLSIGYSRATRILDTLEEQGLIEKAEGGKPRKVIKSD